MHVVIVGTGYVGLVTGACLADIQHTVTCVDINVEKIEKLQRGTMPFFEPGLDSVVRNNVHAGRLRFSTSLAESLPDAEVVIIAVGTPSQQDGHADLQYVNTASEEIGKNINAYKVVVNKSTVPVGTARKVEKKIREYYAGPFDVVSCPEFLREGSAVGDFMHPDRIVIGSRNDAATKKMLELFSSIKGEKVVTTVESAELIKYASNAYLATKISFINEISQICERVAADIGEVAYGVGLDARIGPRFLNAGIGWGGSCFPKDVKALDQIAGVHGYEFRLLKAVIEVNNFQRTHFVSKIRMYFHDHLQGKTLGVLGLAFKGNTDDVRESASLDIIAQLRADGATLRVFDYEATNNARMLLGEGRDLSYAATPYDVAVGCDALIIATEWKQFIELDWLKIKTLMRAPVLFDGRNLLKPERMRDEFGFTYFSVGRNHHESIDITL